MKKHLITAMLLISSTVNAADDRETVRIQISDSGLKPWLNFNDGAARTTFNTAVHHQALYFSPDLNIAPGYIKAWKWFGKEGKFQFTLDTSLKYHNGKPISAYDFEFVLIKPFIANLPTTNERVPLGFIKGIDKLKPGMTFKSGMAAEGIKVLDKDKVDVYLTSGHTRFLYALGALLPALAPIDEFQDDLYTFKDMPVGCGPYRVISSDPKSSLVRTEKVSGKGPRFIEFYTDKTAWENQADLALGGGISQMRKYSEQHPEKYTRIQGILPSSIEILEFNYQTKAAQNLDFRTAVSYAFDKMKEIPGFSAYTATDQIIPTLSYGFRKRASTYDLAAAKKHFNALPKDIQNAEHTLVCHGPPNGKPGKYYEFIRDSLTAIGMKVKLVLSEDTAIVKGQTDATMSVFGRYIDSNPLTSFAFYLPGVSFETLSPNPQYEKIFKKAENSTSTEERSQLIYQLSDEVAKNHIVVPLHQRHPVYFVGSRLKSVGIGDNAWALNVSNIELK